jgi:hypothetical protein
MMSSFARRERDQDRTSALRSPTPNATIVAMSDQAWRPSRVTTIVIGVATIWPIIYMCLFFGFIAYSFSSANLPAGQSSGVPVLFKFIFVLHLLTMLLMFILMAVYIVHAFRTDLVPADKKVLWVVVLFFGSVVAFPIYWYFYMWSPVGRGSNERNRDESRLT